MSDRKHIEKRLRRMSGMSGDKIEAMHTAAASTEWWARCWNCKATVKALRSELENTKCPSCGVNIGKR